MPDSLSNRSVRRLATTVCAALVASLVVACSDGPTTPSMESIAGAYVLQTVDGVPLPVPAYASTTDSITDDGYAIDVDGTYSRIGHQRVFAAGRMNTLTVIDSGTVTLDGKNITLTTRLHGSYALHGTIAGDVMTLSNAPSLYVYDRVRIGY